MHLFPDINITRVLHEKSTLYSCLKPGFYLELPDFSICDVFLFSKFVSRKSIFVNLSEKANLSLFLFCDLGLYNLWRNIYTKVSDKFCSKIKNHKMGQKFKGHKYCPFTLYYIHCIPTVCLLIARWWVEGRQNIVFFLAKSTLLPEHTGVKSTTYMWLESGMEWGNGEGGMKGWMEEWKAGMWLAGRGGGGGNCIRRGGEERVTVI